MGDHSETWELEKWKAAVSFFGSSDLSGGTNFAGQSPVFLKVPSSQRSYPGISLGFLKIASSPRGGAL